MNTLFWDLKTLYQFRSPEKFDPHLSLSTSYPWVLVKLRSFKFCCDTFVRFLLTLNFLSYSGIWWPPPSKKIADGTCNMILIYSTDKHSLGVWDTLPETNIAPENWPSQNETSISTYSNHQFVGCMLVFRGVRSKILGVSFRPKFLQFVCFCLEFSNKLLLGGPSQDL